MRLITVSGPCGAGVGEILEHVRESFPGILHVVERNGYPIEVVEEGLFSYPQAIIEATPVEVQKLHLFAGKGDRMFRIFVSAERGARVQRLCAAFRVKGTFVWVFIIEKIIKIDTRACVYCLISHLNAPQNLRIYILESIFAQNSRKTSMIQ